MVNGKFFATLIALISVVFLLLKLNFGESRENYWGNIDLRARAIRVMKDPKTGAEVALPSGMSQVANLQTPNVLSKGDFYQVPGTWQSSLSPRIGLGGVPGSVNAYIRYNPPSVNNMAYVPNNPLTVGKMIEGYNGSSGCGSCGNKNIVEGFCGSCGTGGPGCRSNGSSAVQAMPINMPPANYAAGNYNQVKSNLQTAPVTASLPVGDMTMMGADGDVTQPIVYDRFIYANTRSRLYGLGDFIRGDLAITPHKPGWFTPSVDPQIDLNPGAMAVLGGINNDTSRDTYNLINAASGGVYTLVGGVDLSTQQGVEMTAAMRDVNVTTFP